MARSIIKAEQEIRKNLNTYEGDKYMSKGNGYEKPLTLTDIAKQSGVSVSTVSRVINGSDLIGKKTTEKVQKIIAKTNYIPNDIARGLKKKASGTIALTIPDILNPFYAELIQGIEEVINSYGYSLILCNSNMNFDKEMQFIHQMVEKRAEGIIFLSTHISNPDIILKLREKLGIVAIQTDIDGVDCVDAANYAGIEEAIQYLIDLGHRKIGFITSSLELRGNNSRYNAYKDTLLKNGIAFKDEYVTIGKYQLNEGYLMTKKLLELPDPPTAIQANNDNFAFGSILAIMERNLKIPEDISIIGFDNIKMAEISNPPLTTVSQPIYEMGCEAAELLIQNIAHGPKKINKKVVLPTKLVVRGSTAPPKALKF